MNQDYPVPPPDFRALCAELVENLERYQSWYIEDNGYGIDDLEALLRRADAALAEPEPQGPTDEELLRVAASAIDPYESSGIAIGEYEAETECAVEIYGSELIAFARAVLTRWGHHTSLPH